MAYSSSSKEDGGDKIYLDYGVLAKEVSDGKNIIKQPRENYCDSFAKNEVAFCLLFKNLPAPNLKSF